LLYSTKAPSVIYVPGYAQYGRRKEVVALETVLAHRMYRFLSCFKAHDVVGVKACETHPVLAMPYARSFVRLLQRRDTCAFLCGTSKRHMDGRSNAAVRTQEDIMAQDSDEEITPFIALDGFYGEHEISHKTNRSLAGDVFLAGELPNLDGLISVACFVASGEMDVGGSLVNLGQGLASKKGKILQRTTRCPQVNVKKCYKCRRCVRQCPTHAITLSEGHAVIDPRKCIKCGKCVEVAHYGGITYDWDATPEHYDEAVIRHAQGVLAVLEEKVICINIVLCENGNGLSFAGGMVSKDPVALDRAMMDLCESQRWLSVGAIQRVRDRIAFAKAAALGTATYEMETVAY